MTHTFTRATARRPAWLAAALLGLGGAQAGEPAATSPRDLQPAVDTSAPQDAAPAPQPAPAAKPVQAPAAPAAGAPAAAAAPGSAAAAGAAPQAGTRRRAMDRLELDATQITGNRELPKVMYVVPWKRSDLGDMVGRPANSLLDEVLAPVDRDVFKRQNTYFEALRPDQQGR